MTNKELQALLKKIHDDMLVMFYEQPQTHEAIPFHLEAVRKVVLDLIEGKSLITLHSQEQENE